MNGFLGRKSLSLVSGFILAIGSLIFANDVPTKAISLEGYNPSVNPVTSQLAITDIGEFMIGDGQFLWIFDRNGSLKKYITMQEDERIASFAYLPYERVYVVCNRVLIEESNEPKYVTRIFDITGGELGIAKDGADLENENLFFYQIMTIGDRVFANSYNQIFPSPDDEILSEVTFDKSQLTFEKVGLGFEYQTLLKDSIGQSHRFRYLAAFDQSHLLVTDTFRPQAWLYESPEDLPGEIKSIDSVPYNLLGRRYQESNQFQDIEYMTRSAGKKITAETTGMIRQEFARDRNRFSRLMGTDIYKDDILLAYTAGNSVKLPTRKAAPNNGHSFTLLLQLVERNNLMERIDRPIAVPGGLFIGAFDNSIFVLYKDVPNDARTSRILQIEGI